MIRMILCWLGFHPRRDYFEFMAMCAGYKDFPCRSCGKPRKNKKD